ncbi:MAG: phosphate-starvation-inducible PsiE family protein [Burkholderiales bacterium]|nr:phosphate-starvation-inducible PsiE family protein [Burkholderiales bacterium]
MRIENGLISGLKGFNQFLHVVLALALAIASVMVIVDFTSKALASILAGNMAHGFLEALGSLFILWTLSTLISAEITYVRTNRFHARVFVEVALIAVLRALIIQPVQVISGGAKPDDSFNPMHYGMLLAALLVVGIVYKLVGDPGVHHQPVREEEKR